MAATVAKTFHVSNDSPSEFPSSQEPLQAFGWWQQKMIHVIWTSACFWQQWFFGPIIASEVGGWEDGENWRSWQSSETSCREVDDEDNGQVRKDAKGSKAIHFQTDVRWHGINHGRGGRWARRADQKGPGSPGGLATPSWWGARAEIRQTGEKPSATGTAISTTQKIKTERQSILEAFKGKICKTGWQARALQGGGPGVTLLPVVLQGDLPVWAISIAVSAGSLGSEGELVCALFCGWLFLRLQMKETNDPILRCIDNQRRKGPLDGERQPVQPEYTHAGPALHTELLRHRRTWCAISKVPWSWLFFRIRTPEPIQVSTLRPLEGPHDAERVKPQVLCRSFPFRTMDKSDASPHPETSKNYGVRKLRCVATRTDLKRRRQLYVAWTVSTGSSKQTAGLLAWSAAATQWIFRNGDQQLRNCYAPFMAVSKFRHAFFQVTASRKYFWPFKRIGSNCYHWLASHSCWYGSNGSFGIFQVYFNKINLFG